MERYALVVTGADRYNERAQLYTKIQATIAQQVQAREQVRQEARQQVKV